VFNRAEFLTLSCQLKKEPEITSKPLWFDDIVIISKISVYQTVSHHCFNCSRGLFGLFSENFPGALSVTDIYYKYYYKYYLRGFQSNVHYNYVYFGN
jgi:hypothetical protein